MSPEVDGKNFGERPRRRYRGAVRAKEFCRTYPDHNGRSVTTYYTSSYPECRPPPRLSLHLYTLSPSVGPAPEIGRAFLQLDGIEGWGNARNWWPRVDIYSPLNSLEECMQHHRQEKEFRKQNGGLHIVPNWSRKQQHYGDPYRNVVLVIPADCGTWGDVLEKGMLFVQFDLDKRLEFKVVDFEPAEWDELEDETLIIEKTEFGPDPLIDRAIVGEEHKKRMLAAQQARYDRGDYTYHHEPTLFDHWSTLTLALMDCTYRMAECDLCDEGVEHADCEAEKDMHYFNDDGECIACAAFQGPWPDDTDEEQTEGDEKGNPPLASEVMKDQDVEL